MDLRDLRYFEVIAELEHVGKAAERLHRTQPALTAAVRRLELEAGAPLFERSGRGIRLTSAGEVLQRWAQRLRFDTEDARREIADLGHGVAGHVRIGIVPTAAQFMLPRAVRALMDEAPDVTLKTTVALVDVMVPMLLAGEIDLVVASEVRPHPGIVSTRLVEDSIVVAAHADHPVFAQAAGLKALLGYRWVLQSPGAPTRDWLDHTFERHGLPRPAVQVESSMLIMLPALIAETGLLSFISRHHLCGAQPSVPLREVRLKQTTMRRRLVVMQRTHAYVAPVAQRLIGYLKQEASRS